MKKKMSMKALIAETLKEQEIRKDEIKTRLDWSYMEKSFNEKVSEKEIN